MMMTMSREKKMILGVAMESRVVGVDEDIVATE